VAPDLFAGEVGPFDQAKQEQPKSKPQIAENDWF